MLAVKVRGEGTPAGSDGVRELESVRGGGEMIVLLLLSEVGVSEVEAEDV